MKYYIIALVVIVAAGAVIAVTMMSRRDIAAVPPAPNAVNTQKSAQSNGSGSTKAPTPAQPSPAAKPVGDRQKLSIAIPGANATKKDNDDYYTKVSAQAIATTKVDIAGCAPDVLVAKFNKNQSLTFKNPDSKSYTVFYKKDTQVVVGPNAEKQIRIEEPGIYAYTCGDSSGPVGLLMVTAE